MKLLYIVVAVLAVMGTYMMAIMVVQSFMHKGFDEARLFVDELIKDCLSVRSKFRLECSKFPIALLNDIRSFLSESDFERWHKRFGMLSQCMEESGITQYGLPYYQINLLLANDDNKLAYENMIRNLAGDSLYSANCTERRVCIEWIPTSEKDFQMCRIVYARTALEQDRFIRTVESIDSSILKTEVDNVCDSELDIELQKYGESKNE